MHKLAFCLAAIASTANSQKAVKFTGNSVVYIGSSAWASLGVCGMEGKYSYARIIVPDAAKVSFWNGGRASLPVAPRTDGRLTLYNSTSCSTEALIEITGLPIGKHEIRADIEILATKETVSGTYTVAVQEIGFPARRRLIGNSPSLDRWEAAMLKGAKKWCGAHMDYGSFGFEHVWFYDGGAVFLEIADYTGDRSWEECAYNILRQYADNAIRAKGIIQGWRVFTRGLRMAYERTGEQRYKDAIILLAKKSNASANAGSWQTTRMRETAFALISYMDAMKVGEPEHPLMKVAVEYILWHYDQLFRTDSYNLNEPFMVGLEARALIRYYEEVRQDPRVIPTIKLFLDWVTEKGYDRTSNMLVYNPDPPGPRCNPKSGGCQKYHTGLMNLVIPAFWWYAYTTGDAAMQAQGDLMFKHAHDGDVTYSGKQFSQNFTWSFEGVLKWRYATSKNTSKPQR